MSIIVRSFEFSDLECVVNLHLECFEGYFLSKLGRHFLSAYYRVYLKFGFINFVAVENDNIVGFVFGYKNFIQFNQELKRNFIYFIFPLCLCLLKLSIYKEFFYKLYNVFFKEKVNVVYEQPNNVYEISSLCVSKKSQGRGIGSMLIEKSINFSLKDNARGVCIITDKLNNKNTIYFYESLGFKFHQEFIQGKNRLMLVLLKLL